MKKGTITLTNIQELFKSIANGKSSNLILYKGKMYKAGSKELKKVLLGK